MDDGLDQRQTIIGEQIDLLGKCIDDVGANFVNLADRLRPCLKPEIPKKEIEEANAGPAVPLAFRIWENIRKIKTLNAAIQDVFERCEL